MNRLQKFCFALLCVGLVQGCVFSQYQTINTAKASWERLEHALVDKVFSIEYPPNGKWINKPVKYFDYRSVEDYKILSEIGYDYGLGSYNVISEVTIAVSVSRIDTDIVCNRGKENFGECILKDAKASTAENQNSYEEISGSIWFREEGAAGVDYSILLSRDHYLSVELNFWDDILKRSEIIADRKKLFQMIIRTARLE